MTLSADRLAALDAFILDLNRASAEVILPLFRADHGLEDKGAGKNLPRDTHAAFDPVTEADRGAEAAIRKLISEHYPEHGVIGEEYGEDRPDAEFVWVLDPIDGTRAFISGLPLWTTLIGLRHQGRPVLGSIGQPFIDEVFVGHAGGSRLVAGGQQRAIRVRECANINDAVIATTDPDACFDGAERGAWLQVRAAAKLARLGCDAYAYAMVAMGKMDMVIEAGLKSWDIEAAIPVVEGAGGMVTNWRGEPVGPNGGQMVISGDRRPLDEALVSLKRSAK
ncbi:MULTISPECIES: histidinol-phosphatase [unclassified Caulobacter]|jgi:histidinol phosphatase-like enzyme (inositol monophosphatase family)|uniref:histidinol-phosphatase n=1 Tax=unclassified Caulobacter TaxID=2648921 RepID=UPI0007830572|nr:MULTISPECIES: histidinol-phosphatase [unclassified Caulobacter]AZS22043.1 histidinol-phosphatase [Caulobacter sp. FWC26]